MATNTKKKNSGRSWKNERASVKQNRAKPKTNKYSASDKSKRDDYVEQYWRAGYTRADGTKVKGHYVKKKLSLIEKIKDVFD